METCARGMRHGFYRRVRKRSSEIVLPEFLENFAEERRDNDNWSFETWDVRVGVEIPVAGTKTMNRKFNRELRESIERMGAGRLRRWTANSPEIFERECSCQGCLASHLKTYEMSSRFDGSGQIDAIRWMRPP